MFIAEIWRALTIVLCSHAEGYDLPSLGNIMRTTNISIESLGVPNAAKSFWHLSGATNQNRLWHDNIAAREVLVSLNSHVPAHESEDAVTDLFGEVDMFLGNVALGLQATH
eukprot:s408_g32.t1